jgi:hypothetical protein
MKVVLILRGVFLFTGRPRKSVKVDAGGLVAANDNSQANHFIRGQTFAESWHFRYYGAGGSLNPSDIHTVLLQYQACPYGSCLCVL